jgi:hypothetical protein
MKVAVLTTSYPRGPDDVAGAFVRDAVLALRSAGVDVEVVSPASFRHFGLAYGHGILGNLRRRPWKVLVLPVFLASYSFAARRAARNADLVHAHWLPSALPALKTRKPFVLQLWGTDVELASSLETARCAIVSPTPSVLFGRASSARTSSTRRWSSAPLAERATASLRARPWLTGAR